MRPRKKVKLADIAEKSGVSIVTVSNALAGKEGVSEEMRTRIKACAEQLGYSRTESAQQPEKETYYITVLFSEDRENQPESSDPFMSCLRKAADRLSITLSTGVLKHRKGGHVPTVSWQSDREGIMRTDGILVYGSLPGKSLRDLVDFFRIPVVGYGFMDSGVNIDYIMDDSFRGMRQAVRHLVGLGHRNLVYISEEIRENKVLMDRLLGFWYAMYDCGLIDSKEIPEEVRQPVFSLSDSMKSGEKNSQIAYGPDYLHERIRKGLLPDAVVCSSDQTAQAVRELLDTYALRVPGDLSLTGYRTKGKEEDPFWSSCEIPLEIHAEKCLELLRKRISKGGSPDGVRLLSCDFVCGKSTGEHKARSFGSEA